MRKSIEPISAAYLDWSKAARARLPALKPSTTAISLRLPVALLERIRIAANKRDMPYQSLIEAWLAERLDRASYGGAGRGGPEGTGRAALVRGWPGHARP